MKFLILFFAAITFLDPPIVAQETILFNHVWTENDQGIVAIEPQEEGYVMAGLMQLSTDTI